MTEDIDKEQQKYHKLRTVFDLFMIHQDTMLSRIMKALISLVVVTVLTIAYSVHLASKVTKLYEQYNIYFLLFIVSILVVFLPAYFLNLALEKITLLKNSEKKLKDDNFKLNGDLTKISNTQIEEWNATLHQFYPDGKHEIIVKSKTVPRMNSYVSMHQVDNNEVRHSILVATVAESHHSEKCKLIRLTVVAYSDLAKREDYRLSHDKKYVFYLSPITDEVQFNIINISSYNEILDTGETEDKSLNEYLNSLTEEKREILKREFGSINPYFNNMSSSELKDKIIDFIKERMSSNGG